MAASRSINCTIGYRKVLDPVLEVVEGQLEFFALHELDDASAH